MSHRAWLLAFRISGALVAFTLAALIRPSHFPPWLHRFFSFSAACYATICLLTAWRLRDPERGKAAADAVLLRESQRDSCGDPAATAFHGGDGGDGDGD